MMREFISSEGTLFYRGIPTGKTLDKPRGGHVHGGYRGFQQVALVKESGLNKYNYSNILDVPQVVSWLGTGMASCREE
jgi:hypothetical protein